MNNHIFTIGDIEDLVKSIAEDLRKVLKKDVDVFEINEINKDSDFYNVIMKERLLVA